MGFKSCSDSSEGSEGKEGKENSSDGSEGKERSDAVEIYYNGAEIKPECLDLNKNDLNKDVAMPYRHPMSIFTF